MNIKRILDNVLLVFDKFRHAGHTELIKKIGLENDVYIVIAYEKEKVDFPPELQDKLITLDKIHKLGHGYEKKPIVFDNHVIVELLNNSFTHIKVIERNNAKYQTSMDQIQSILDGNRGSKLY